MTRKSNKFIEWWVSEFTMPGQSKSGDAYLVKVLKDSVLVAAVDGLGHGETAYKAARTTIEVINNNSEQPVVELIKICHNAIARTIGAAVTISCIDAKIGKMTWSGVGNVEGVLLRKEENKLTRESLLLRSGVVGYHLPALKASSIAVKPDDMLIFNTDGIRSGFTENINLRSTPQIITAHILKNYGKGIDDAMVLAVRWTGGTGEHNI